MYAILLKMCFGKQTKLQIYLISEIFNLLAKAPKLHRQQGPMIQSRAKIPSIHLVFYGKSHEETDLTKCGKNLAEPVKALSMTSSEQWHTYLLASCQLVTVLLRCTNGRKFSHERSKWLNDPVLIRKLINRHVHLPVKLLFFTVNFSLEICITFFDWLNKLTFVISENVRTT